MTVIQYVAYRGGRVAQIENVIGEPSARVSFQERAQGPDWLAQRARCAVLARRDKKLRGTRLSPP